MTGGTSEQYSCNVLTYPDDYLYYASSGMIAEGFN